MRTCALIVSRDFQPPDHATRAAYEGHPPWEANDWRGLLFLFERGVRSESFFADQTIAVVGDLCLYERPQLARSIGRDPQISAPELILRLYESSGTSFVSKLRGEFSFILADIARRRVIAAADRLSSRPLYYTALGSDLVIASKISTLAHHPRFEPVTDPAGAIAHVLEMDGNHDRTFLRSVRRLPPSNILEADRGGLRRTCYWNPRFGSLRISPEEAAEECRRLLLEAIRRRHAPGRTALFLSGGIDSGSIAALAATHGIDLKTYSLRFPGDRSADEASQITLLVDQYRLAHQEIAFPDSAFPPGFPYSYLQTLGLPDLSYFTTLHMHAPQLAAMRRDGVTIALTGLGGDHVFGARLSDLDIAAFRLRRGWPETWERPKRRLLSLIRHELIAPAVPRSVRLLRRASRNEFVFATESLVRHRIWRFMASPRLSPPGTLTPRKVADLILAPASLASATEQLALLSERFGIDTCHPFLDPDLIEFVLSATPASVFSPFETKAVLRAAVRETLPDAIRNRSDKATFNRLVENDVVRTSAERQNLVAAFAARAGEASVLLKNLRGNGDNVSGRQISRIASVEAVMKTLETQ